MVNHHQLFLMLEDCCDSKLVTQESHKACVSQGGGASYTCGKEIKCKKKLLHYFITQQRKQKSTYFLLETVKNIYNF